MYWIQQRGSLDSTKIHFFFGREWKDELKKKTSANVEVEVEAELDNETELISSEKVESFGTMI